MDQEKEFMTCAIQKAKAGIDQGQTPFGACIVKEGQVISCCHNTVWLDCDITAHAEVNAIRQACKKLNSVKLTDCVIYSTCEPCPMCFSACHWSGISRIVYGASIDDAKNSGFSELSIPNKHMKLYGPSPVEIVSDFMRDENLELFSLWSNRKDKRIY